MQSVTKLIKEYKMKVEALDADLKSLSDKMINCKRDADLLELRTERKVKQAQRQCYYQVIEDLKDVEFDQIHSSY